MKKKMINERVLQINNRVLEEAIRAAAQQSSRQNVEKLMDAMKGARFLVPAQFPKNLDRETVGKIVRGEKLDPKSAPRLVPLILSNQQGERFAPAFTSKGQIPEEQNYPAIINITAEELLRFASDPKLELKGILLNPATDKMILHPQFIEALRTGRESVTPKKEVRMTREQFVSFARKNVEWGIFPKAVFTGKAGFMQKLEEEREEYVLSFYRQPYGDKIPCPYAVGDFDVMLLDIDEETSVAAVGLPERNAAAQAALSIYIIWNPRREKISYYLIEKGQPDQENVLSRILEDGRHEELQTAPAPGSELAAVLELLREEEQEQDAQGE